MIGKYLVVTLTASAHPGINISFASQHGIETLSLHESSLELSVEETHNSRASEEKIEHPNFNEPNLTTSKYIKARNFSCFDHCFMGISDALPRTVNDHNDQIGTDFLNMSSANHLFNGKYLNTPIVSNDLMGNANSKPIGHVIDSVGESFFSNYPNRKMLNFMISINDLHYNYSFCATYYDEYGPGKDSNELKSDVCSIAGLNSSMVSGIWIGTFFKDDVPVYGGPALKPIGRLKGHASLAAGALKESCPTPYGNVQSIKCLSKQTILNFIIDIIGNSFFIVKHNHINGTLDDCEPSFKRHVDSCNYERLQDAPVCERLRTFNAFQIDGSIIVEFSNLSIEHFFNNYLQNTLNYCTNLYKHDKGSSESFAAMDAHAISPSENGAMVNGNYSIFERSIAGSEEHTGDSADMVSGHLCGALFVNQLTPEDNEVVPQNDTILEISIIESSNINGLLMQT